MQSPREVPNPLRPYYVPPSIGVPSDTGPNASTAAPRPATSSASPSFSFPDLDYSDYVSDSSASVASSVKTVLDKVIWKYSSVLMAQPFEVAKLILQTHVAQEEYADASRSGSRQSGQRVYEVYDEAGEDSSDDEPNYFTSTAPFEAESRPSPPRGRRGRPQRPDNSRGAASSQQHDKSPHRIRLKNQHSLLDALSSLSANSGPISLWRATNTTFIYTILLRTFESFFRSFLAAVFGVAETDILIPVASGAIPNASILTSTAPLATVLIATVASAISAIILAPIDAARTRIILTPSSHEPRSLLATLRTLSPAYLIPTHLVPVTFLTSTLPSLISTSTPLVLKNYFSLDPVLNPTSWSIGTFAGSALDLTVRFPLETVLRRAQIATWTAPALAPPTSQSKRKAIATIVPVPQVYRGILPTMWTVMREEGYSESAEDKAAAAMGKAPQRRRKGQGIEGLYRGWRVGMWGLVGVWGAAFIGGLQADGEATLETPGTGAHGGKF